MSVFRILITGSRDWSDEDTVWGALDIVAREVLSAGCTEIVVVHGAAKGPDMLADAWVRSRRQYWPVRAERYPADWKRHGRAAGLKRNPVMVSRGADVCLAFALPCTKPDCRRPQPHYTHGTEHCAGLAEREGIPTRWFRPNPPEEESTDG